MLFCPKCGSLLRPTKEHGKTIMACSCGYSDSKQDNLKTTERVKSKEGEVVVADEDDSHLPETDAECSKCGNGKAWFWLVQTRAGDEPETKFLKCTKCKHIWRDYH